MERRAAYEFRETAFSAIARRARAHATRERFVFLRERAAFAVWRDHLRVNSKLCVPARFISRDWIFYSNVMREERDMEDGAARAVLHHELYLISYEAPGIIEFPGNANCYTALCAVIMTYISRNCARW